MEPLNPKRRELVRFLVALATLTAAFVVVQWSYIHRLPFVMDEYVSAYDSYVVLWKTPYAEYVPYKNLLGYYVQAVVMWLSEDTWSALLNVKRFLVILNATMIVGVALTMRRLASGPAALAAVVLLVCMSTFLERSHELRVDMMTAWAGTASMIAVIAFRPALGGALACVAFLTSQKGIYYVAAGEAALLGYALVIAREARGLMPFVRYNVAAALGLATYIGIFSVVAGFDNVIDGMFFSHEGVIFENVYGNLHKRWWGQSFWRNPVWYALLFIALWRVEMLRRKEPGDRLLTLTGLYGVAVTVLCFMHPKPWPYFLVHLFPPGAVVMAVYFDREDLGRLATWGRALSVPLALAIAWFGVARPVNRVHDGLDRIGLPRHEATVRALDVLVDDGETYLAGINYLFKQDQVHESFSVVSMPHWQAIRKEGRARHREYVRIMQEAPLKAVVVSYRTKNLPRTITRWIGRNYKQLYSTIHTYAPRMRAGEREFDVKFAGRYQLHAPGPVVLNGETIQPRGFVTLRQKKNTQVASSRYRLQWSPKVAESFNPAFADEVKLYDGKHYKW